MVAMMKDWEKVAQTLKTIWGKTGTARVVDKERGEVVVPCGSKLSALMCAASVWGILNLPRPLPTSGF